MTRRDLMKGLGALSLGALAGGGREEAMAVEEVTKSGTSEGGSGRMPAIFAAHGAPVLLDDAAWMGELAAWAAARCRDRGAS